MKKLMFFGMMGAMALTFNACSSDDALVDNPNYDASTNEVKTSFVFNVNTGGTDTRMSGENVQADGNFRGMQDVKLLTVENSANGKIVTAATTATKAFDLGQVLAKDQINNTDKSHRILELALPVKTNSLLFYGKAFKDGNATDQGVINGTEGEPTSGAFAVGTDLSSLNFALTKRLKTADKAKFEAIGTAIAAAITDIMDTEVKATFWWPAITGTQRPVKEVSGSDTYYYTPEEMMALVGEVPAGESKTVQDALGNDYTYYNQVGTSWYAYGKEYTKTTPNLVPLEEILGEAYHKLVTIEAGAVRAGSGAAVARTITDLWSIVNRVANAEANSDRETIAIEIAKAAVLTIKTYFNDLPTDGESTTWKALEGYTADDVNGYPENLALPMGAAQLLSEEDASAGKYTFKYAASDNLEFHMGGTVVNVDNLMYPSELMYFGNSPIRTSSVVKTETQYPDGVANWDNEDNWDQDWTANSQVASSTRSVAMTHDINYGNALLETTVQIATGDIEDNREHFFPGEGNAKVSPNFTLTGVLIGGQPGSVDWQFLPKNEINTKVVYDRVIPFESQIPQGSYSPANYTMVLDNYYAASADQLPVYVALEFKNNSGSDFWGDHNVIRKDGTFYLVGKLDPAAKTKDITWPETTDTYRTTAPYTADGKTNKVGRVFIQDFVTKAKFTIGKESLKSAFVTVPDLRSSEITLGLSVDINWEAGFEFESILGATETPAP